MKKYLIIAVDEDRKFLLHLDVNTSSLRKAWEQTRRMFVGLPVKYVYLVTYRNRHLIAHGYVHGDELCAYGRVPRGADVCFVHRELGDDKDLFVKVVNVIEEEAEVERVERCADRYYSSISDSFPDTSKYW